MDKRKNNKGTIGNKGGRPKKVDEEHKNHLFAEAIKKITRSTDDDESKIKYIVQLADFERGKIFIAEHVFGKPENNIKAEVLTDGVVPIIQIINPNEEK